jgi:hypothetical protein
MSDNYDTVATRIDRGMSFAMIVLTLTLIIALIFDPLLFFVIIIGLFVGMSVSAFLFLTFYLIGWLYEKIRGV